MKREVLAYCAGIIDADGTIGIKKSTYAMRVTKDCQQAVYSERVCVKQVERQAIDLLHELFKGYRARQKASAEKGKPLEAWQVTDLNASVCLKAILPFLRIKKQQAINCLELRKVKNKSKKDRVAKGRGHAGSASRKPEASTEMERLYLRAKELNHVGI